MELINELVKSRPYLAIRKVDNYQILKSKEKSKRSIEVLEVKNAIHSLGFDSVVSYKESGQPILENHPEMFISISHSKGWFAVYISDKPIGIDIEVKNQRLTDGCSYFLNDKENHFQHKIDDLEVIWGVKEAFYKLKEGKIADLKNDVTTIDIQQNHVVIEHDNEHFIFEFVKENDVTIVLN